MLCLPIAIWTLVQFVFNNPKRNLILVIYTIRVIRVIRDLPQMKQLIIKAYRKK